MTVLHYLKIGKRIVYEIETVKEWPPSEPREEKTMTIELSLSFLLKGHDLRDSRNGFVGLFLAVCRGIASSDAV